MSLYLIWFNPGQDPVVTEQYVVVDMVSNDAGGRWTNDIGQSGTLPAATPVAGVTVTPVELISMYRKINYTNVLKADLVKDDVNGPKNRIEQLKAVPNGTVKGSWAASPQEYDLYKKGTPGAQDAAGNLAELKPTAVNLKKVIINEIGNGPTGNDKYDWIELRNTSGADIVIENYELSNVVGTEKKDLSLIIFPKISIPKDGVLLVLNTDPKIDADHPIAGGVNVIDEEGENAIKLEPKGVQSRYYVNDKLVIPDSKVLLLLRSAKDKTGKAEALVDVTGTAAIADDNNKLATKLWPLVKGASKGDGVIKGSAMFGDGTVHRRAKADQTTNADEIWVVSEDAGGIGYKRAEAGNGTPGYVNGAAKAYDKKSDHADYAAAPVTISEIMYHTGRNLPQWIELYNHSLTDGVKLNNWTLEIENDPNDDDLPIRTDRTVTLTFANDKIIPPNETVLIATTQARRRSSDEGNSHFPDARVIDIYREKGIASKNPLDIDPGTSRFALAILSQTAFKLTLKDAAKVEVDVAGNLGEDWALPTSEDRSGNRHSIIRRYDKKSMARDGTAPIGLIWMADADADADADALTDDDYAWLVASDDTLSGKLAGDTYYGSNTDLGTPGYRRGGALPVSLSKFRPERLDSGAVVVRWITESELNNAGFNILRSETRDGEFTKLNTRLIAGQGTISERTVYEYADTSAKPNVVYYYQIQDVSLDGKVQTLRTNRLKGDISADGKLTTIWGELKTLHE